VEQETKIGLRLRWVFLGDFQTFLGGFTQKFDGFFVYLLKCLDPDLTWAVCT